MDAAEEQSRDMRNVGEQQRADFLCDLAETLEVPQPWIRRAAGHDNFRPLLSRHRADLIEVDDVIFAIDHVLRRLPESPRDAYRPSVRQMPAMGEHEAHDRVARLKQR